MKIPFVKIVQVLVGILLIVVSVALFAAYYDFANLAQYNVLKKINWITSYERVPFELVFAVMLLLLGLVSISTTRVLRPSLAVIAVAGAILGEYFILSSRFTIGIPLLLVMSCCAAFLVAPSVSLLTQSDLRIRDRSLYLFLFIMIIAIASLTRFYRIDDFEQRLCYSRDATIDVPYKGEWAMDFIKGRPYTAFILHWGERETLYIYLESLLILLFGQNLMSLTLLSILSGIIAVIFGVFLFTRLYGMHIGLLSGFLMAVSPWFIAMNRISERFNFVPMFTCIVLALLIKALQDKHVFYYILAGSFLGLGLYTFPAYRVVPGIAGIACVLWFIFAEERRLRLLLKMVVYWIFAGIVALAPLKFNISQFINHFVIAKEHGFKMYKHKEDIIQYLIDLLGFFHFRFHGDMAYSSGRPLMHPLLAVFFTIGLFLIVRFLYQKKSLFISVWFFISLLPVIISDPVARRMGVTLPLVFGLSALGIWTFLHYIFKRTNRLQMLLSGLLCLIFVLGVAANDVIYLFTRDYDVHHTPPCALYRMEEYVRTIGPYFDIYTTHMGEYQQLIRYLTHSQPKDSNYYESRVINPREQIPLHVKPKQNVALVIGPEAQHQMVIPLIKEYYPRSIIVNHEGDKGALMFTSIFISKDEVESNQGLMFKYRQDTSSWSEPKIDTTISFEERIPDELPMPLEATWDGSFYVPKSGIVRFSFKGTVHASLAIDNQQVWQETLSATPTPFALFLFRGMHSIQIGVRAQSHNDTFAAEVALDTLNFKHIPPEYFCPFPAKDNLLKAPPWKQSDIQYTHTFMEKAGNPFTDQQFLPSALAVSDDGRIYIADGEHITIACYNQKMEMQWAMQPLLKPPVKWTGKKPFTGERNRQLVLRITNQNELLVADQSRNIILCFDLDGNLKWETEPYGGQIQRIITDWNSSVISLLVSGGYCVLDTDLKRIVPLEKWRDYLKGYYEVNAMITDSSRERVYFYDGAYETILMYNSNGTIEKKINNLYRHDYPKLELLPDGTLLFSALRSANVYAFTPDGECLIGRDGNPPINIIGWQSFDMIADMYVASHGDFIYVLYFNGSVQQFSKVKS